MSLKDRIVSVLMEVANDPDWKKYTPREAAEVAADRIIADYEREIKDLLWRLNEIVRDARDVAEFVCGYWPGLEDGIDWGVDDNHDNPVFKAASRILDATRPGVLPQNSPETVIELEEGQTSVTLEFPR
jgi:hypothetical protein